MQANPTLAAGDVTISKDGGAFANLTTLPVVTPAAGRAVKVTVSATEMTADNVVVIFSDASGAEWDDLLISIATAATQIDDLATAAALATVQADTDDIQTRLPAALVTGRIDASVGAMAAGVVTAAAVATDAIDGDAIAATAVTEIQSGLATAAALTTVQADTDDIQARLPAALVAGRIDSSVGAMAAGVVTAAAVATGAIDADAVATDAVAEIADGLWDELRTGHNVAGSFGESFQGIVNGEAAAGTLTTTQFTTNLTEATNDHYNGRIVVWLTGALTGQATDITAYTGATKLVTVTAMTEAPAATDRFVIV